MKNQAQFHPTKYLVHLVQIITEKGGLIFENTTAVNIETENNQSFLHARDPVSQPIMYLHARIFRFMKELGLYSTRMHADRSYALAVKQKRNFQVECILVPISQPVHFVL